MTGTAASAVRLVHGKTHRVFEVVLLINHPIEQVRKFPEEFVLGTRTRRQMNGREHFVDREVLRISCASAMRMGACSAILVRALLEEGDSSLWLGYRNDPRDEEWIAILERIPFAFDTISARAEGGASACRRAVDGCKAAGARLCPTPEVGDAPPCPAYLRDENGGGSSSSSSATPSNAVLHLTVPSLFHAPGKWQVAHAFAKRADYPLLFLWRCEVPAHFEMHSHVMSNHCAPLPAIWEKSGALLVIKPEYDAQDALAGVAKGVAGEIGKRDTATISTRLANEMRVAELHKVFPFLKSQYALLACLMPMDMEYMHFDGYFGIPVMHKGPDGTWWYCWNKKWKNRTNRPDRPISKAVQPETPTSSAYYGPSERDNIEPPVAPAPSDRGEVWCYTGDGAGTGYVPWSKQLEQHVAVFSQPNTGLSSLTASLPFLHLEPRRHATNDIFSGNRSSLEGSLSRVIQSNRWDQRSPFFGIKLYTAMGWAPRDPLLRDPLQNLYIACENDQIPLLNHCTPMGFYTHDRQFYFDLLDEEGLLSESANREDAGWPTAFPIHVPMPDGRPLTDRNGKRRHPATTEEKAWWFIQNYVSPAAWHPLIHAHPRLKLCLAHLGDSAHFDENGWGDRKVREPASTKRQLTIAFDGPGIDRERSHAFLADLIDLVQPWNRVFIDLSYVLLNESNAVNLQRLIDWARIHKPIMLERLLWGTDWPLPGNEPIVKGFKSAHDSMLHRYAQGFRGMLPHMPGDFFLRASFLNPIQYLGLHGIAQKLQAHGMSAECAWLEAIDPAIFEDFAVDKLDLFYRHHKELSHPRA